MRQRPFGIAGERHGLPLRVFAPQRGLRCMDSWLCIGLIPSFSDALPPGLNGADDRLAAFMHMDVLDRDPLLTLSSVSVQRLKNGCVGARQLVGLIEGFAPAFKGLVGQHGAPIALHCGTVSGDELAGQHALQLVFRCDSDQAGDGG